MKESAATTVRKTPSTLPAWNKDVAKQ